MTESTEIARLGALGEKTVFPTGDGPVVLFSKSKCMRILLFKMLLRQGKPFVAMEMQQNDARSGPLERKEKKKKRK